ncbi:MAG TPA: PH domain-containing protein [Povalibacter sp.]|uniref:PH domain-containing protein n=1 Tax=Povalibacter sp. TaxID=1962978 RepID=UPI002BCE3248|nr:PH domain-containing protein [Povalibacter sp.]HMN46284.1 PH domain-containing protein [Povalibacter sp.]
MQTSTTDPAIISVWRWQWLIALFIVFLVATATLLPRSGSLWASALIVLGLSGVLLVWLWPPTYYRHLRYGVDATGIVIERGVLWRSHIALPRARIQHTDVSQGPLQRRYGVGTLKLYTAGSRHTMIELPGLAHPDAIALRDALLAESTTSGV